jgi:hypothetical protein
VQQRFTFIPGDAAVAVEAETPEGAHTKALATRDNPDAWHVVVCADTTRLAKTDYAQTLLERSGLSR